MVVAVPTVLSSSPQRKDISAITKHVSAMVTDLASAT